VTAGALHGARDTADVVSGQIPPSRVPVVGNRTWRVFEKIAISRPYKTVRSSCRRAPPCSDL